MERTAVVSQESARTQGSARDAQLDAVALPTPYENAMSA